MQRKSFIIVLVLSLLLFDLNASFAEEYLVTEESGSNSGSLYAAVMDANRLQGDGHVIRFSELLEKVRLPGEVPIRAGIEFYGEGITIEGSGTSGLFKVTDGKVLFDKITFTGGNETDCGGAVEIKGENASVEFKNCTFFNNRAGLYGGAVCVTKTSAGTSQIPAVFQNCTIAGNYANEGGGIAIRDGIVSLNLSIVAGNFSGNISGDIFSETTGFLTGKNNIAGKINVNQQTSDVFDFVNQNAEDIFTTDSNGKLRLEKVNGIQVLKLSGNSIAKNILLTKESYVLDVDQTGNSRPQLGGYDAGALESVPVEVLSVDVRIMPYLQINTSDKLTVKVYPEDSSVDSSRYSSGLEWVVSNSEILDVDSNGNIRAVGEGTAYVTAIFHGFNSDGTQKTVRSNAVPVHTGVKARESLMAAVYDIDDIYLSDYYQSSFFRPEVVITMNGYKVTDAEAGRDYSLSVSVLEGAEFITAEIVSDDGVLINLQGYDYSYEEISSVRLTVNPLPSGTSDYTDFNVHIEGNSHDDGRRGRSSSGGGGCNSGIFGAFALLALSGIFIRRR